MADDWKGALGLATAKDTDLTSESRASVKLGCYKTESNAMCSINPRLVFHLMVFLFSVPLCLRGQF